MTDTPEPLDLRSHYTATAKPPNCCACSPKFAQKAAGWILNA